MESILCFTFKFFSVFLLLTLNIVFRCGLEVADYSCLYASHHRLFSFNTKSAVRFSGAKLHSRSGCHQCGFHSEVIANLNLVWQKHSVRPSMSLKLNFKKPTKIFSYSAHDYHMFAVVAVMKWLPNSKKRIAENRSHLEKSLKNLCISAWAGDTNWSCRTTTAWTLWTPPPRVPDRWKDQPDSDQLVMLLPRCTSWAKDACSTRLASTATSSTFSSMLQGIIAVLFCHFCELSVLFCFAENLCLKLLFFGYRSSYETGLGWAKVHVVDF